MDRHVDVPVKRVAFFESVRFVFDTGMILKDKLEDGCRTPVDKIDRDFYEIISSLLRYNGGPNIIPFK